MKLTYAIIPVLVIALLLTGCATTTEKTPRKLTDYVGGTGGLSIEFEDEAPPGQVFDDGEEDFFIALKVENEGEYTIEEGGIIASLSGISKIDFSLASLHKKSNFDLERTYLDRSGGIDTIDFGDANYKVDLASDFSTRMIADVCYDYRTVAAAAICLKKDTRQHKTADACLITNEDIPFENSAAPIQITDIDEASSGSNKIKLNFVIENEEAGWFYKPGTFKTECIPDDANKEENYVYVEITDPANRLRFQCSALGDDNKGEVKMYDGKKQISCTLDTNGLQETAYEQLIDIKVDYMYRGAVEKEITIQNADVY
ncbi:MAG: hypothetical protein KKA79_05975 [Nanoarchaeota archaeon]|nr:hypothetical protein [Nanoarchaeota archaeon]MCG2717631.1 hypothetical protein [Nanoarchaeota archaeon]